MIRQRRGSNLAKDDEPARRPAEEEEDEQQQQQANKNEATSHHPRSRSSTCSSQCFICSLWQASLHLLSVLLFIFSVIVAQTRLKSHEECDMTYSRRHFVELSHFSDNNNNNNTNSNYRVFQFTDQRDPRHRALLREHPNVSDPKRWCLSLPLILYVPGHGGSYEQSRSLGAHGLQLTRLKENKHYEQKIARKLRFSNHTVATSTNIDDFFYDVIALDFGEEGGGFHGAILQRQAAFLARTVLQITQSCPMEHGLTIVAHSIGGISTRWALQQYPAEMAAVRTVVTLGTPHAYPVLSWESQLHRIYRELWKERKLQSLSTNSNANKNVALVSISGGLRDEMIPPMACFVDDNNQLALLATDLMPQGSVEAHHVGVALGMDHRAVVWCHNLLTPVRRILYALLHTTTDEKNTATGTSSVETRLSNVLPQLYLSLRQQHHNKEDRNAYNFRIAVGGIRNRLQKTYGYFMGWAMETGLLYSAEILVHAFVCIGAFRYLQPQWRSVGDDCPSSGSSSGNRIHKQRFLWLPSLALGALQYCTILQFHASMDPLVAPRFSTVLVLSLVADSVFLALRSLLNLLLRGRTNNDESKSRLGAEVKHLTNLWIWGPLLSILLLLETTTGDVALLGNSSKSILCAISLVFAYICGLAAIAELPPKKCNGGDLEKDSKGCWMEQQLNFTVWIMVLLPIVALGDVVVIAKGLTATWVVPAVALLVGVRLWLVGQTHSLLCNSFAAVERMILTRKALWFQAATLSYACWAVLSCNVQSDPIILSLWPFHPLALPLVLASATAIVRETSFYVNYKTS